jgi:hypothetical protein
MKDQRAAGCARVERLGEGAQANVAGGQGLDRVQQVP